MQQIGNFCSQQTQIVSLLNRVQSTVMLKTGVACLSVFDEAL